MTPADLLVASMAPEPFSSTYLQAGIGGAWDWDLSGCNQCETKQTDALPTELWRLDFSWVILDFVVNVLGNIPPNVEKE